MSENPNGSVIQCPSCSKQLVIGSGQTHCHNCYKELPPDVKAALKDTKMNNADFIAARTSQTGSYQSYQANVPPPSGAYQSAAYSNMLPPNMSHQEYALLTRYTDAYRKARLTVLAGNIIKGVGIVLALLFLIIGLSSIGNSGYRPDSEIAVGIGITAIAIGVIGGAVIFIIGILVSAQGQTLKATLDSAVNSSPFLTNEQRARIMSLPLS